MNFIGIDNGVSGSIGIVNDKSSVYLPMPIKKSLSYTKQKAFFNRVDTIELLDILMPLRENACFCILERPMVNPGRFQATVSALRALEATLIVIEEAKIPYRYIDSKEWQRAMFPQGLWTVKKDKRGRPHMKADPIELKLASLEIGKRLFPQINFTGCDDADGLLIAEYARRTYNNATPT